MHHFVSALNKLISLLFPDVFTEILIRTFYGNDVDEKITNTMYL